MTNPTKFDFGELPEGPWSVDPDHRPGMEWNNHIIDANDDRICFMAHSERDNSKHEAAARAIAAIPDMLAEIERLREDVDFQHTRCADKDVVIMGLRDRNAELEEALETFIRLHGEFLMDAGPCDHSVGICICPEIAALDKARALLDKEESNG